MGLELSNNVFPRRNSDTLSTGLRGRTPDDPLDGVVEELKTLYEIQVVEQRHFQTEFEMYNGRQGCKICSRRHRVPNRN